MGVYITHHDESIYNIKVDPDADKSLNLSFSETRKRAATRVSRRNRINRLIPVVDTAGSSHGIVKKRGLKIPPVPTREVLRNYFENMPKHEPRNAILENMERIQSLEAKQPQRMVMDSTGRRRPLHPKGYGKTLSEKYGQLPSYVNKMIKQKEEAQLRAKQAPELQPKCRYVIRAQRDKLLKGLKENWDALQSQYKLLSILTDTLPKINRKAKLEAELKQLEKDIVLIERHPYIYVYND